ncbi:MAG TPA: hypothetical protein VNN09_12225 [Candidatus Competibacteraceae bacterium]|nr:hypothetical protein [Candidatus Competibacteraceae bacterium]
MILPQPARLRALIGCTLSYRGQPCPIIEVLEEGPALVLEESGASAIQANQYGEASRRAPRVHTVSVWNVHRNGANPLLPDLPALLAQLDAR